MAHLETARKPATGLPRRRPTGTTRDRTIAVGHLVTADPRHGSIARVLHVLRRGGPRPDGSRETIGWALLAIVAAILIGWPVLCAFLAIEPLS